MKSFTIEFGSISRVTQCIHLGAFSIVLFNHSTDKFRFVPEELYGEIMGVILLLQGEMKSQGLVLCFQIIQAEVSWKR